MVFGSILSLKAYQFSRIYTWLNLTEEYYDDGFQLINGLIAFSYGGLVGKGFGASYEKYGYIPESHNDFIAQVIYEELGMSGFFTVL